MAAHRNVTRYIANATSHIVNVTGNIANVIADIVNVTADIANAMNHIVNATAASVNAGHLIADASQYRGTSTKLFRPELMDEPLKEYRNPEDLMGSCRNCMGWRCPTA
ncbi:MAG: hypothetical protein HC899_07050 [Leptolyngbyaceae cyanobacterium SM1_4_3]|nr:hypothetical protein [Leptolyngbyaceae cyanobacterium SM1_4_3]